MKKLQFIFTTIMAVALLYIGCSDDESTNPSVSPVISSINPDTGYIGEEVTISGTDFGSSQGTSKVTFNSIDATDYTSWTDTEIVVEVPTGATTGKVSVTVSVQKSNEVDFTVNTSNPNEVTIGTQTWMQKNLDVATYRNGDPIPQVTDTDEWANLTTGAWCNYDNDPANGEIYGKLYNWYAVNDPRGLAPAGWHVPTDEEWKELEICLGMSQSEADKTGFRGTDEGSQLAGRADLWYDGDLENNANFGTSGFSALPGGYRYYNGLFLNIGNYGRWWSSSEYSAAGAWYRHLLYDRADVHRYYRSKEHGLSVRVVRD